MAKKIIDHFQESSTAFFTRKFENSNSSFAFKPRHVYLSLKLTTTYICIMHRMINCELLGARSLKGLKAKGAENRGHDCALNLDLKKNIYYLKKRSP